MKIEENIRLAPFTTFQIGGPARYFCEVKDEHTLVEAVHFARSHSLPIFVLGGGSNLLVSDNGFPGLVLHIAITGDIQSHNEDPYIQYDVPAGHDWDAFVFLTCERGLAGIECLAGIPGLVGGSPIQNIGAYGQEVSQTIASVRALDLDTLTFRTLPAAECGFAYRHSIFNSTHRNRYIVTHVTFRFRTGAHPKLAYAELQHHFEGYPSPTPLQIYDAIRFIRDRKGMLIVPGRPNADSRSAGSFFKNPAVPPVIVTHIAQVLSLKESEVPHWLMPSGDLKLPAAWLIEHAGFPRGFDLGPAGISSRHTLALINCSGTASCSDILKLKDLISAAVQQKFHIQLEQEPVFVS